MRTTTVGHGTWPDEEWEAAVVETGTALHRSHWGRFMRLYGDEADPSPQGALTGTELLSRLADAEALATQLMALQAQHLTELRESRLVDRPRTVGQLNARTRRLLAQARSQDGTDDAEATSAGRYVRVTPADTCGMATLVARLPEADAIALVTTVQALAVEPVDEDDTRTREQREADVLVACVTGLRPVHGRADDLEMTARPPGRLSVRVDVTIPADALVGAGDAQAEIPGYGPVPASTGRTLMESSTHRTARPIVYDPAARGPAGRDMPGTWLFQTSTAMRLRPRHPLPMRADQRREHLLPLPTAPPAQDAPRRAAVLRAGVTPPRRSADRQRRCSRRRS